MKKIWFDITVDGLGGAGRGDRCENYVKSGSLEVEMGMSFFELFLKSPGISLFMPLPFIVPLKARSPGTPKSGVPDRVTRSPPSTASGPCVLHLRFLP